VPGWVGPGDDVLGRQQLDGQWQFRVAKTDDPNCHRISVSAMGPEND
jgi:hypothetical protein